jgi:hypothetical protein
VNGDGTPDLVVSNFASSTVSVRLNIGTGSFGPKTDYPTGTFPFGLTLGDVNGDGKPDLATANFSSSTVSVLLGNGNGTFAPKVDYGTRAQPYSLALGDVSGDGKLDLVETNIGNAIAPGTASVLPGNGDGTFGAAVDFGTAFRPYSVAIADVSGDGKPDLVTANSNANSVSILRNLTETTTAITLVTLSAEATAERVRLEWYVPGDGIALASLYRRTVDTDWTLQGHPQADQNHRMIHEDYAITPGVQYGYRLVVRDVTGYESSSETWVRVPGGETVPPVVRLEPSRPNPFGERGELSYGLPVAGRVRLAIYDLQGRRVAVVVDREEPAGWRTVVWDGRNSLGQRVASGTYFERLEEGNLVDVRKIVVAR